MAELELEFLRNSFREHTLSLLKQFHVMEKDYQQQREQINIVSIVFAEMSNILTNFQTQVDCIMKNRFELLPAELLVKVFSFVNSPVELGRLCKVCKVFNIVLRENHLPWKKVCNRWWLGQELHEEFDLQEEIVKESMGLDPMKDWRWLGVCIARENQQEGASWLRVTDNRGNLTEIIVGEMHHGLLNGFGFTIFCDMKCIGVFRDGKQLEGVSIFPGVERYKGEYSSETGHFDGRGYYKSEDKGWIYEGQLSQSEFHGKGIMKWPTGFQYEGEWQHGEPIDKVNSLHPDIRKCIERGVCTGEVTEDSTHYGQFFIVPEGRDFLYCLSCAKQCYPHMLNFWKPIWYPSAHCSCVGKPNCKVKGSSDPLVRKDKKIRTHNHKIEKISVL